jgi:hypothetical protein
MPVEPRAAESGTFRPEQRPVNQCYRLPSGLGESEFDATRCGTCRASESRVTGFRSTPARGESAPSLLESRVREIRPHGSEGGVGQTFPAPLLPYPKSGIGF